MGRSLIQLKKKENNLKGWYWVKIDPLKKVVGSLVLRSDWDLRI